MQICTRNCHWFQGRRDDASQAGRPSGHQALHGPGGCCCLLVCLPVCLLVYSQILDKSLDADNFGHFKAADMYAFALVVWEVLQRVEVNKQTSKQTNKQVNNPEAG